MYVYMTDCECELSNTSRFGFQSTGLRIMIVLIVLFLKSLYNYRDIIHPLLFHLYRQLLGHKAYIVPSQTIPKEG